MKLDLGNLIATQTVINPRTVGVEVTTVSGTGVDRKGYESAILVFTVGGLSGTPSGFTVTCTVKDSSDNSSFSTVSALGSILITASNTRKEFAVQLDGRNRYISGDMAIGIAGGTAVTAFVCCSVILGSSKTLPV